MLRTLLQARILVIWVLLLLAPLQGVAATSATERDSIRAAFIFNIARFATWPADTLNNGVADFTLCIYGSNYLGSALDTLKGKRLHQRPVRINLIEKLDAASSCQLLVIPGFELPHYQQETKPPNISAILTITDLSLTPHEHAIHEGILIAIVRKKSSLGFEINRRVLEESRLKLSSELLKLAAILEDQP